MSKLITQNDLTGVLNEVLPFGWDDDIVKSVIFNISSVSLTANGTYTNTAIDVSAYIPNGYKLIDVDCKATGANNVYCYHIGITGPTTVVLQLRNIASSASTVTPSLKITCIKQQYANVGAKQADYIVEQGTSGDWIYRKWNSGVAECWRITSVSVTSYSGWGNQYYSSPYGTATFTTGLFTETPVVNVFRTGGAEGATVASGITKTGITQLYIVRPNAGATGTLYFSIHAIGKWK